MKPLPDAGPPDAPGERERLSGLVDGECASADLEDTCSRWARDKELQRDWRMYHLIGDVLRSEELGAAATGDGAFLTALRPRLAAQPTPLAPAPLPRRRRPATPSGRSIWPLMVAGLAGVVVTGSAVWMLRPGVQGPVADWGDTFVAVSGFGSPGDGGFGRIAAMPLMEVPGLADAWNASSTFASTGVAAAPVAGHVARPLDRQMLRDARLDAYIEAHRDMLAPLPVAMPGAALRGVDIRAAQR
ncbi:MAG: sigma-E factor negative regulatory protein [Burkholderiales bacterium]|nr:sigma-E factor negative regulatory protein [Burkholderiales bacterium]